MKSIGSFTELLLQKKNPVDLKFAGGHTAGTYAELMIAKATLLARGVLLAIFLIIATYPVAIITLFVKFGSDENEQAFINNHLQFLTEYLPQNGLNEITFREVFFCIQISYVQRFFRIINL